MHQRVVCAYPGGINNAAGQGIDFYHVGSMKGDVEADGAAGDGD